MAIEKPEQYDAAIIDGHVHMYPEVDLEDLLTSAANNIRYHHSQLSVSSNCCYGLLLTLTEREYSFASLTENALKKGSRWTWCIHTTDEAQSLIATNQQHTLTLFSGHQIVTCEKIEVLVAGSLNAIKNGQSLNDTVSQALANDMTVILPWGVGKWLGRRGKLVKQAVKRYGNSILLGDNRGRPWFWQSRLLSSNANRVLPGSDSLPINGAYKEVGSLGGYIYGTISRQRPWQDIHCLLSDPDVRIMPYGRRCSGTKFVMDQLAVRA